MGSYAIKQGAWPTHIDTGHADGANSAASKSVTGTDNNFTVTANAYKGDATHSSANGVTGATLEGEVVWEPAGVIDPPTKATTTITVIGDTEYTLTVNSKEEGESNGDVKASAILKFDGKDVDTNTIYQRKKSAPGNSTTNPTQTGVEFVTASKTHTGGFKYTVIISLTANCSAKAQQIGLHPVPQTPS